MAASCDMRTCLLVATVLMFGFSAAVAAPLRGPRRMLASTNAVVRAVQPQYYVASNDTRLPLCATQIGASEGVQLTGNDAAQAAWYRNTESAQDPNTMVNFESCSGNVSNDTTACWSGTDVRNDLYFVELACYTLPKCQTLNDTVTCVGRRLLSAV